MGDIGEVRLMVEIDVKEKRTMMGSLSLIINTKPDVNSIFILPYESHRHTLNQVSDFAKTMEMTGYSCNINFESENIVCVR